MIYDLSEDGRWELKEREAALEADILRDFARGPGWIPARVPGTVHEDLLRAGRIPDPFFGRNELLVQHLGERDFLYRRRLDDAPAELARQPFVDLVCEGLDTFATLWLNDQELGRGDNMFVPLRLPLPPAALGQGPELRMLFEAAMPRGKERERAHGRRALWNGDASRLYVRKAQYHYGWDWGPCLLTAGPFRPLRLHGYRSRIAEVAALPQVDAALAQARVPVTLTLAGDLDGLEIALRLEAPDGRRLVALQEPARPRWEAALRVAQPQLWWPVGQGAQPRYRLVLQLLRGGVEEDRRELQLGLRHLELLREPMADGEGESFAFAVNGRVVFCGGANWIPADSFLPRVDAARYRALLQRAVDGGMNMIRVWGGGVYEEDVFYDLCDELGLLVWQDFMFACGLYPAEPWFLQSVQAEAEAALARLRHHPSIVLWCGNNEDYALARSLGHYQGHGSPPAEPFPARVLYERLLPEVCARLDGTRPYWPGSPYGGEDPNDKLSGDRHTWDVWHGAMADYQHYGRFGGRFVSEFGMQAHPAEATLRGCLPAAEQRPGSPALLHHNKADGGPMRLAHYIDHNLPPERPEELASQIYASQLMQAEALGWAYRSYRRRFGGPGQRHVSGALVWQLNDCWPVTSWAIIDYALREKGAYYAIRRELAPLTLGLAGPPARCALWAQNGTAHEVEATVELAAFPIGGGAPRALPPLQVRLPPNQALELGELAFSQEEDQQALVCGARLLVGREVRGRAYSWPEPLRDMPRVDPGLALHREGERLTLRAARPAKGVWLVPADGRRVRFEDNMLDVMPDEERTIHAAGLGDGALRVFYVGQGHG